MTDINKTLEERGSKYGKASDNARVTRQLMRIVEETNPNLSDMHHLTLYMIMHKISRMVCGDQWFRDNPHDIAGYATLLEEFIKDVEQ